MSIELLNKLTGELNSAAENQDWDKLYLLISQLDEIIPRIKFLPTHRSQLNAALGNLNQSISAAAERRDEIRSLVSKLSDTPI